MVEYMKDNVMRIPRDYMKKFKTNEYYQGASEKAAKKRLRRIVMENVKKVATGTPVNPPLPQATSSSTATLSGTSRHPLFHLCGPCRTSIAYHCHGNRD